MSDNEKQLTGSISQEPSPDPGATPYESAKDNTHNRDTNSKTIFDNPILCAQFLRDNFDLPELKNIRPEDIQDVSNRYFPYLGTELDTDSVKKIRILDIEKEKEPPFLISLIDHKSLVDYDVPMQLLRYMMCIWTQYRREMELKQEGCSRLKSFRYPMIIPIIYYEGKAPWTADMHLKDRIRQNPGLQKWIPDFQYEIVRVHDYSNRELLDRGDEMSLIMLVNKIQDTADLEQFIRIPADELNSIVCNSPEAIIDVLVSVMESLCFKIDASAEERKECVRKVRTREMGYLFENMDKISIQEERRKTEEQRKRAESAEEKLRIAERTIQLLKEKQLSATSKEEI